MSGRSRSFMGIIPEYFSRMTGNDPERSVEEEAGNDRFVPSTDLAMQPVSGSNLYETGRLGLCYRLAKTTVRSGFHPR